LSETLARDRRVAVCQNFFSSSAERGGENLFAIFVLFIVGRFYIRIIVVCCNIPRKQYIYLTTLENFFSPGEEKIKQKQISTSNDSRTCNTAVHNAYRTFCTTVSMHVCTCYTRTRASRKQCFLVSISCMLLRWFSLRRCLSAGLNLMILRTVL